MINFSKQKTQLIVWSMLSLMIIIGMCIDLVAPSLPAIATGLAVSKTLAKNVISIYLLGYAFGNFLTGFLADAWGRQKLMRISLFVFTLGSVIPIVDPTIDSVLMARLIQGYTIGAVSVLLRTTCADILLPEDLTKLGPWFGTIWGLGPVVGPIIGGYLQTYFGWKAGFYFFTILGLTASISIYFILPETHFNRHPLHLSIIKKNILEVLRHRLFMGIAMLMGLTYAFMIAFNVAGPFLIQEAFHQTPLFFGHVAFLLGLIFLVSTLGARYLISKTTIQIIWRVSIFFSLILTGLFLIASFYANTISWIVLSSALLFSLCGFVFPVSLGKGLSLFRHVSGTATAVMYLVNIGITSIVSYALGFFHIETFMQLMVLYGVLLVLVTAVYLFMLRK